VRSEGATQLLQGGTQLIRHRLPRDAEYLSYFLIGEAMEAHEVEHFPASRRQTLDRRANGLLEFGQLHLLVGRDRRSLPSTKKGCPAPPDLPTPLLVQRNAARRTKQEAMDSACRLPCCTMLPETGERLLGHIFRSILISDDPVSVPNDRRPVETEQLIKGCVIIRIAYPEGQVGCTIVEERACCRRGSTIRISHR
jgi:hypothetical protein